MNKPFKPERQEQAFEYLKYACRMVGYTLFAIYMSPLLFSNRFMDTDRDRLAQGIAGIAVLCVPYVIKWVLDMKRSGRFIWNWRCTLATALLLFLFGLMTYEYILGRAPVTSPS